jgi:hypothetical protein
MSKLDPKRLANLQKGIKLSHDSLTSILELSDALIRGDAYDTSKIAWINKKAYDTLKKLKTYCDTNGDLK